MDGRPEPAGSEKVLDVVVRLGFVALLIGLVYLIFAPLFPSILWGNLLAIICAHPYEGLVSRLRGRRLLADLVFGLLLFLVLLIPALFFAFELIRNFPAALGWAESVSGSTMPGLPAWVVELPVVGAAAAKGWADFSQDLDSKLPALVAHLGGMAGWAFAQLGSFGAFLFQFTLGAVISLFILHHRFAVRSFLHRFLLRVGGQFADGLVNSAFDITRAAFMGVIAAALAQTLLASVAIWFAGLPVILFAGFTFLLALVQIGPAVIMVVACGTLWAQGKPVEAGLMLAWFTLVVASIDNLIKPYLASAGSEAPAIVTFLGTIGGFLSWGLLGVFVGPVLTSVLYDMLIVWIDPAKRKTA